jgi:hypothetical protein
MPTAKRQSSSRFSHRCFQIDLLIEKDHILEWPLMVCHLDLKVDSKIQHEINQFVAFYSRPPSVIT